MEIAKKLAQLNIKVDRQGVELNTKFESLSTRMRYVEGILATPSVNNNLGQLPGKAIQNPKEYATAHAITICHDRELPTRHASTSITRDNEVQEGEDFVQNEIPAEIAIEKPILDRSTRSQAQEVLSSVKKPPAAKTKDKVFVPPPYKPSLPFPGRFKKQLIKKYEALLKKQLKDLEITMPLVDCLALIPDSHKHVKDMITEMIKEVQGTMALTHECSAIIQKNIVQKKFEDPGSFTLPCSIRQLAFSNYLCDLGASVSLMPLSVARKLRFVKYKSCDLSLLLTDRTLRKPYGLLEDMPIKINGVELPTDFVVLEMDEEPKDPLILGRPFLASVGAVIDIKDGNIDLNLGKDIRLLFDIKKAPRRSTVEGQTFGVQGLVTEDGFETERVKEPSLAPTRPSSSTTQSSTLCVVDWLELKRKSDLQEETIQKLACTVEEFRDKVSRKQREAIQPLLGIEAISKKKFFSEWPEEEDYPQEIKEAYKERTIEYSITDLSREYAKSDVVFAKEEEKISVLLYHPP